MGTFVLKSKLFFLATDGTAISGNQVKQIRNAAKRQGVSLKSAMDNAKLAKGAKNAWSRLGKAGKISCLVAAGTVGGLGVSALMGGKKSSSQNNRLQ